MNCECDTKPIGNLDDRGTGGDTKPIGLSKISTSKPMPSPKSSRSPGKKEKSPKQSARSPSKKKLLKCSSCDQKFPKSDYSPDELDKEADERRCMSCVASTQSLFSAIRVSTSSRTNEQSAEAEVQRLRSRDPAVQAEAANRIWELSRSGDEETDRELAAAGAIGPLVELLRCRDAAWFAAGALQSLSCRSGTRKTAIVTAGALPHLVALLRSGDADDQEVVAMALANIAMGEEPTTPNGQALLAERQRAIVRSGALGPLVDLLAEEGHEGSQEAVAGIIANLAASTDEHGEQAELQAELQAALTADVCADVAGALTALATLLRSPDSLPEVHLEAARALRLLARKDDSERIAAVARALGLEAGSGAVGDVPDERCVDEEVKRILREHSERFLERQHAQEEDTES